MSAASVSETFAYLHTAPLASGSRVRLITPSGPGTEEGRDRALAILRGWGLEVVPGAHLNEQDWRRYLAGPDRDRAADLVEAWTDPDTDAVVALRGGYGAMRLLDGLDWEALRAARLRRDGRPKLLVGSSDITALHQAFRVHLGVPTLFTPMPGTAPFRSETVQADVHRWFFEPWAGLSLRGPVARTLVPGTATGVLEGGNLSLVAASIGAPEHRHPRGIALLEDVGEDLYRLDNLLIQLQRSGWFTRARAVALGSWEGCGDPDGAPGEIRRLLREYLEPLGIPVAWELGFGHDPEALSVPLGVPARLTAPAGAAPTLTVLDDPTVLDEELA